MTGVSLVFRSVLDGVFGVFGMVWEIIGYLLIRLISIGIGYLVITIYIYINIQYIYEAKPFNLL